MSPPPCADSSKDVDKKSAQRKINKPLIEKRRRARINDCLAQLKSIVLEANESKSPRPSKLEKADILEMTVEFVKSKVSSATGTKVQKTSKEKEGQVEYLAGYTKCLAEISNFLENTRPNMSILKRDIMSHVTAQFRNRVCQDTSNGQDTSLDSKPEKLPVPNLKIRNSNSTEEAVDLRINSTEAQLCGANQKTLETKPEINNHTAVLNDVSHPNMPLGLLCGGQVMLLVQFPPSVAPQQFSTSYGQYSNLSLSSGNISVQHNTADTPNTIDINKTDDKVKFIYDQVSSPQTLESTPTTLFPLRIGSIPSVDFRTFNFGSNEVTNRCPMESREHWRPW